MTKLIDKLSFLLTPNGYKTGSLYPYAPIENDSCYGFVPGISGNFFSTPDNINNRLTDDFSIEAYIEPYALSLSGIVSKSGTFTASTGFIFRINSDRRLDLVIRKGSTTYVYASTDPANYNYVRVSRRSIDGVIKFFSSPDGNNWIQLGSDISGESGSINNPLINMVVGKSYVTADSLEMFGLIKYVRLYKDDMFQTVTQAFDPRDYDSAFSTSTWRSSTGETWTINGSGTYIKESILDLSFSRNSIATRINQPGNIETVQANVPRIHYPVASQNPVILLEPQRTNICLMSEDFSNSIWTKVVSIPIDVNNTIAPDGTLTADNLRKTQTSLQGIYQIVNHETTGLYTESIFAKANSSDFIQFTDSTNPVLAVNLTNGQIAGNSGTFTNVIVENFGKGWYRISYSRNRTSTGNLNSLYFWPSDRSSLSFQTTSSTCSCYVWGAQIEQGSYPTTYIPTQGSTITRLADSITSLVSNYGSVAIGTKGTIHFDATMAVAPTVENFTFLFNNQYQNSINGIRLRLWSTGTWSFRDTITGSDITPNLPINTRTRVTFVIDGRIVLTYINGIFYSRWARPTPVDIQRISFMFLPSDGGILHLHELAISQDILTPEEIAQLSNDYTTSQQLQTLFQARVSADSGILESSSSLGTYLTSLQNINLA